MCLAVALEGNCCFLKLSKIHQRLSAIKKSGSRGRIALLKCCRGLCPVALLKQLQSLTEGRRLAGQLQRQQDPHAEKQERVCTRSHRTYFLDELGSVNVT